VNRDGQRPPHNKAKPTSSSSSRWNKRSIPTNSVNTLVRKLA